MQNQSKKQDSSMRGRTRGQRSSDVQKSLQNFDIKNNDERNDGSQQSKFESKQIFSADGREVQTKSMKPLNRFGQTAKMRQVNGVMLSPINFTVGRQSLVVPAYLNPSMDPDSIMLNKSIMSNTSTPVSYPSIWQKQDVALMRSLIHVKQHQDKKEQHLKKRMDRVA